MVLVSMTILIIMGTLFTTISMRSYLYSYAKLCKQQAYYTAMSSVQSFHSLLKGNPSLIGTLTNSLNEALDDEINAGLEITDVTIEIGSTYGGGGAEYVPNGFFDSYMGRCTLKARYASADRNEISIEANANYKGYSDFARARIARTNAAASELKKIFDNTFCLQSPISTLIGTVPNGDIYISQPVLSEFVDSNNDMITDGSLGDYNEVVTALKETGTYKGYSALPGQYIRDANGNVLTSGAPSEILVYNSILRTQLYGNVQASTGKSDLYGHTRPMDVDNYPMPKDANGYIYFNDWVELYMFAPSQDGGESKTAVNGNVYANSRVLIGLLDRDRNNRLYPWVWDDTQKRMVYPKDSDSDWFKGELPYAEYISPGDTVDNYEHGFTTEVFFDHSSVNAYNRKSSQFRVNGNMYFWEDVRIENFDSMQTENAANGIKNNIYAYKDLVIDGTYIIDWNSDDSAVKPAVSDRYVTIYGDVIVQGDAEIIGANITGDVYCFGNEMKLIDSNVNGNVYFAGAKFTADFADISGNLIIEGQNAPLNYTQYGTDTGQSSFESSRDVGNKNDSSNQSPNEWGAVLTNTDVRGTLWSAVNTHIIAAKWSGEGGASLHDVYGNIFVNAYLFMDMTRKYSEGYLGHWYGVKDNEPGSDVASAYNSVEQSGVIYADRMQVKLSQKSGGWWTTDVTKLDMVCVGTGGLYFDGHSYRTDEGFVDPIRINTLYTMSKGKAWETEIKNGNKQGRWSDEIESVSTEATLIGQISAGASSIEDALNRRLIELKSQFGLEKTQGIGTAEIITRFFTGAQASEIWEDKVIKLRKWSSPQHVTREQIAEGQPGTYYNGYDIMHFGVRGFDSVDEFKNYLSGNQSAGFSGAHPEAGEISADGKTLTIKESVVFGGEADFSSYETVVFDTSEGNIHIRFQDGAIFGKNTVGVGAATTPSKVVLRGGNMVFVYLEQEGNYDMNNPTLIINDGCSFGVVEASQGTNYGNDGLYVISNDDILIRLAGTTEFNGFVYAPWGHLFIMPGNDGTKNTFNGCMAIESLIIYSDAKEAGTDIISIIVDWWDKLVWNGKEYVDPIVPQYANCVYNYVMPPLIVDAGMSFGGNGDEVEDFGQVVWEFMGFY